MLTPQQEIQNTIAFFKANNLAWLGKNGDTNGNSFADFIVQWGEAFNPKRIVDVTPENLAVAYKKLQEAGHQLIYYSPDETQYHILEEQNPGLVASIRRYLPSHRLEDSFSNVLTIAKFVKAHGWGIESSTQFTRLIGNLQNSRHGQYGAALEFKPNPDELRRQKESEQHKATPLKKISEEEKMKAISHIALSDPNDPYRSFSRKIDPDSPLGQHQAAVHAAMAAKQAANEPAPGAESVYKSQVDAYLASIYSNNDRAEATRLFGQRQHNGTWEVNLRELNIWWERRKNQRDLAGRM